MARIRWLCAAAGLALASLLAPRAWADDPPLAAVAPAIDSMERSAGSAADKPEPLRFRRIFAPAGRVQDWPRGQARYVPVDGEEFERLIKAAQDRPGGAGGALAAVLLRGEYTAQFDGVDLLTGSARCEIRHTTRTHTLLPLNPFGFALRRAWWRSATEPDVRKPVELGAGENGELGLVVVENGELEFEWSLRGERDATGCVSFTLKFPRCADSELLLTAPRGMVATMSEGLVLPDQPAPPPAMGALPIAPQPAQPVAKDTYRILLGGKDSATLRVTPQAANAAAQPKATLRENVVYDISPRGVDVTATWKLDVQGPALRLLRVVLDPGLQLVSARLGETDITWSVGAHAEGDPSPLFLTLPEPFSGADRSLRLAAIGPLELNQARSLPRIRAVDAFWQEGTYTLLVREPLAVTSFHTTDCRQTKYSVLPEPNRGEAFDVQMFGPTADVRLSLARRQRLPALLTAVTVEIGADEARAVLGAAIETASAAPMAWVADVLPGWTIDAVESRPAEALADWKLTTGATGGQLLLRWKRTAATESPPLLFVRGHRRSREPAAAGQTAHFRAEDLLPLEFRDVQSRNPLLRLRPQEGYDVRLLDAQNLPRLDFESLTAEQTGLFVDSAPTVVYSYDPRRSRFTAFLQELRPHYAAEVRSEATVAGETLTESYALQVAPEGSRVSKLLVQFSQPREQPLHWRLLSEGPTAIVSRKLTDAEQRARGVSLAPEAWELSLSTPRSAPFAIGATRSLPLDAESQALSLATLPDANSGQGRLTIKAGANESISITNQGLTPVALIDEAADGAALPLASRQRACFEYGAGSGAGGVTVARTADGLKTADAIVWRKEIQSWEDSAGAGVHLATFRIQNAGCAEVFVSNDYASTLDRAWCDGAPVTLTADGKSRIPLHVDRRFVTIVVEFHTAYQPPGMRWDIELPPIHINLPVLQTEWSLRPPPGYAFLSVDGGTCDRVADERSWSQRLFGPLGRPLQAAAIDPWTIGQAATETKSESPTATKPATADAAWQNTPGGPVLRDAAGQPSYVIRVDSDQATARLARRSSMARLAVASFTVCFAAGLFLARFGFARMLAVLLAAAAICLVAPNVVIPMATGALWGLWLALVWSWAMRALPAPQRQSSPSHHGALSGARLAALGRQGAPVLLAAAWFGLCDPLALAQPIPLAKSKSPVIHRVFIPVDENEQPTKDKYQVPQELHDELRRRAGDLGGATQDHFFESARYQLVVNREAAADALSPGDVLAQFEVHVLRPEKPVRLPLMGVRPGPVARQDGRVVDFELEMDEDGLLCRFAQAGVYQLEFLLRPARGELGFGGLEIGIPRIARSTLEVQLPTDPPTLDVPGAMGAITAASEGRKVKAELGAIDHLTVTWNNARAVRGAPTTDVDAWMWMQIQPGSVILHAHLDVKPARSAPLRELRLSVDPRLRPLPLGDAPGVITSVQPLPMDPRTIRVELARAISEPTTLKFSFLVTGSSGVGQLQLPQIVPEGGTFSQRVLAVSVDPELQFEVAKVEGETAVAIPEFLAHWGEAPAVPQQATRLSADQAWTISTRPREPRSAAKQTLSVSADETQATIRFETQLTPPEDRVSLDGFVCRHRLRVPLDVNVESVSLMQDGIERVGRFTRDETGEVTVLLAGPVVGKQQLTLNGWLPIKPPGRVPLPRMELLSADRRETTVLIYRQPAVHVTVENPQSLTAIPLPPVAPPGGAAEAPVAGRAVAAFVASTDDYGATLVITPNHPRIRSTQLSSIALESGGWQGRVEYRCAVTDGSLDAVRFKLPPEWIGPFETTPATIATAIEVQGDERRLVVRPKAAIEGEFRFSVRGPIRAPTNERFTLPTLLAAAKEEDAEFVLLPVNVQSQHVGWQVVGLRPEQLPEDAFPSPLVEAHESYRVIEPTAAARLQKRGTSGGEARILRGDVQIAWGDNCATRGVVRFDVQPAGQAETMLQTPPETQILELRVAGMLVTGLRAKGQAGEASWRVPIDSSAATQTVEVAFVGPVAEQSLLGDVQLSTPWLTGLTVERTSWSVFAPCNAGEGQLTAASAQAVRLETASQDSAPSAQFPALTTFGCGHADHWELSGDAPALSLNYRQHRPLETLDRWFSAVALTLAGVALGFIGRRGALSPARHDARAAAGLIVGLAAWAWLSPDWIGMALAAASVAWWIWPRRRAAGAVGALVDTDESHA